MTRYSILCLCLCFISSNARITNRVVIHTSDQNNLLYEFFPLRTNLLTFSVKTERDIHVTLTDGPARASPYYEIMIGGWFNTKSAIRRDNDISQVEYLSEVVKPNKFQTFSIGIDEKDGRIDVGFKPGDWFMSFKDPEFFKMSYFGISTGFGSKGEWHFDFDTFYCGCDTCNISSRAR